MYELASKGRQRMFVAFGVIQEEDDLSASIQCSRPVATLRHKSDVIRVTYRISWLPLSWLILCTISYNSIVKAEGSCEEDL